MNNKILSFILALFYIIPIALVCSACGGNPQRDSNSSAFTPQTKNLTLSNFEQYITITPNLTVVSDRYNLIYDFTGSEYCSFEDVALTYELFDYNVALTNPKVLYDDFVDSYSMTLNMDGNGSTMQVEVRNMNWKIKVLSITGKVTINKDTSITDGMVSLNMSNYQQYLTITQRSVKNALTDAMLYWTAQGTRNKIFIDVIITYDFYDYDYYGNEVIYDEHEYGYIGDKP